MADEELTAVRAWAREVAAALGVASGELDVDTVLDVDAALDVDAVLGIAGLAARTATRPAAPVTTYLLGVAVGRSVAAGTEPSLAFAAAVDAIRGLASALGDSAAGDSASGDSASGDSASGDSAAGDPA